MAGLALHRDMCSVGAIRIGALSTGISAVGRKTCKFPKVNGSTVWAHGRAKLDCDVSCRTMKAQCRSLAYAFAQFGSGSDYRRATHHDRARGIRTEPFVKMSGRTMEDLVDALHWNFERIGSDLRKYRFDALAHRRRSDKDRKRSIGVERNARILLRP